VTTDPKQHRAGEGTANVGGASIHYRLDGPAAAPVLVLANSLGTTLSLWEPQIPRLSGMLRVLRFDQRGHGGSSAPAGPYSIDDLGGDLVALLDALGIDRAALCGISLGGMTAMWVAAHHPERVSTLVAACTAAELGPAAAWRERANTVRASGMAILEELLFERWFPASARAARPELRTMVATMLAGCDADGYASCCEAIATMDLRPALGSVQCPALVIAGAEDPVTTPAIGLDLAGDLGAGLVVIAGAGHLANVVAPDAFTDAVEAHVCGTPRARGMAVRRAVLGDEHVDRSASQTDPGSQAFADYVTRAAWGEIWARPGLDRRARSVATLTALVALGRHEELRIHVPGALRNGLSGGEIREIVLHAAVYAGVPAANSAMPLVLDLLGAYGTDAGEGSQ
jgi:3-oxoadipate enol-lactonase / 4-carboxymuconolactone decarboxylase